MTLRVAVPLLAISLASPAITNAEQAQHGRGYRQRDGGGATAEKSGGNTKAKAATPERTTDNNNRVAERRTETRTAEPGTETRAAEAHTAEREPEPTRYAVPRSNAGGYVVNRPVDNPPVVTRNRPDVIAYRQPGHYPPAQYNYWSRRYYSYGPIGYAPWLIHGSIGFSNFGFVGGFGPVPFYYGYNGYAYGAAYPWPAGSYDAGGIRLKVDPRDAEVFVDGYYAGLVDDFDGVFQSLKVAPGGHKIEIRMPGFDDLELDVHVQPGRTVTLSEQMRRP